MSSRLYSVRRAEGGINFKKNKMVLEEFRYLQCLFYDICQLAPLYFVRKSLQHGSDFPTPCLFTNTDMFGPHGTRNKPTRCCNLNMIISFIEDARCKSAMIHMCISKKGTQGNVVDTVPKCS